MLSPLVDAMSSALASLSSAPPTLIWGVFLRVYGLMFAFAIGMLHGQILGLAGRDGLYPIRTRLDRLRADHPSSALRRFLRYPTLHWLWCSDAALQRLLLVGSLLGGGLVLSGVASSTGFALMWAVYLSYATSLNLMFPWDCLLMESAFLALFLPSLAGPFSLHAEAAPGSLLAFCFRLLIFRLLFGFGKMKFIGASTKEFSYLRGFAVNQPMPSIFGWLMYHLPLWAHIASLAVFFLSEMVVPFFFFSSGTWRISAGLISMGLMAGIQLVGNFGFFNVLTAILCIPLLDGEAALIGAKGVAGLWAEATAHGAGALALHVLLVFLLLLSVVFFPFNSWCTQSFIQWPALSLPRSALGDLLRALSPWHLVHAFGVFFPHSSAGVRWIPIIEGTDDPRVIEVLEKQKKQEKGSANGPATSDAQDGSDGIVWRSYEYRFMTTRTDRMPPFCAPYHYRLDQAILYESIGMTPDTFLATLSSGRRDEFSPLEGSSMLSRVCACLLADNQHVERMFRHNPFPASSNARASGSGGKVQALRISFYLFAPTTMGEFLSPSSAVRGHYWHKRYVGLHQPTMSRAQVQRSLAAQAGPQGLAPDNRGAFQLREPECAHPEHYIAMCDTPAVQALHAGIDAARAATGKNGGAHSIDSAALIATPSHVAALKSRLVQPISPAQVESEVWGPAPRGFVAAMQPLVAQFIRPSTEGSDPGVPQQDYEPHLPEGVWSRSLTSFLSSAASPLAGLDGVERARLEKALSRATLLLVHVLLPAFHGPGADEMLTAAQLAEAYGPGGSGKRGRFCLRPCARDQCTVADHLHLPSFFHLHLFAQHVLLQGRAAYESVLARGAPAALPFLPSFSLATGLLVTGVFHPQVLALHAAKIRLIRRISFPYQLEHSSILPGFLSIYYNFLSREYRSEQPGEGAFSPLQLLPRVDLPLRYDQHWVVHHEDLTTRNAPGLVDEEGMQQTTSTTANGKGAHGQARTQRSALHKD